MTTQAQASLRQALACLKGGGRSFSLIERRWQKFSWPEMDLKSISNV